MVHVGSVLDVISAGRWKSAVFTTFTLSLTYVESHLLPALRRSGCERLTIFADTVGYRDSLVEQRSLGVGRDYSVVPVRVKGGIFHPKLVYLEADEPENDVLLVGSGNVTYPGGGGNIEVLEVLRVSTNANAFSFCADFFLQLGIHERIQLPSSAALERTITRMQAAARVGQDTEGAQFVHSLRMSGMEQFAAAAERVGAAWYELLVLSPYHHPQAAPVIALAERLGVTALLAGVPTRGAEASAFPFAEARRRLPLVSPVAPVPGSKPERNLHAKWFELRGDKATVVLTGSFNATNASFASVDNVECGVLRTLLTPTTCWREAPEPVFRKSEFPQRTDAQAPCVFAVIADGRILQGTLLGVGSTQLWRLTLESADEILLSTDVIVDSQGQFCVELSASFDATRTGTLQVTLIHEHVRASGWVQISQLLRLDARHRRLLDIIRRTGDGTQSADDMQELLDIVAQQTSAVMNTTLLPKSSSPSERTPSAGQVLSTALFTSCVPDGSEQGVDRQYSLLSALNSGASGLDLLEHLFSGLRSRGGHEADRKWQDRKDDNPFLSRSSTAAVSSEGEGEVDGQATSETQKKAEIRRRNLDKVYESLKDRLKDLNTAIALRPDNMATLQRNKLRFLKVWLGLVLVYEVAEIGDFNEARTFLCGPWLQEVCSVRLPVEEKLWMADDVCGVAAVQAFAQASVCSITETRALSAKHGDVLQATNPVRELARRLSVFFEDELETSAVLSKARVWLDDGCSAQLVAEQVDEAIAALAEVRSALTERQVLHSILTLGMEAVEAELASFSPQVAALYRQLAQTKANTPSKVSSVDIQRLHRCPNSSCSERYEESKQGMRWLVSDISWRLNKFGAYRCRCGQFLISQEVV